MVYFFCDLALFVFLIIALLSIIISGSIKGFLGFVAGHQASIFFVLFILIAILKAVSIYFSLEQYKTGKESEKNYGLIVADIFDFAQLSLIVFTIIKTLNMSYFKYDSVIEYQGLFLSIISFGLFIIVYFAIVTASNVIASITKHCDMPIISTIIYSISIAVHLYCLYCINYYM
ncbi:MAG: hypothetical protein ACI4XE_00185 [Acutalibacteraceae bacterium]